MQCAHKYQKKEEENKQTDLVVLCVRIHASDCEREGAERDARSPYGARASHVC